MPYDAFGNKVEGNDPLASMRSSGTSSPSGVPGGPRRGGGAGLIAAAVMVLVVAGIAVGVAVLSLTGEEDPASSAGSPAPAEPEAPVPAEPDPDFDPGGEAETPAAPDPEPDPEPEQPARPATPPTGMQTGSLLRRANLQVALERLRAEAKGRPRLVRVEAQRVDIQVILNDGRMRNAQATWDGEVRIINTTPTPIGGLEGFPWSEIDPAAMPRLVRSTTGRARKPASSFNYGVLIDAAGLRWSAFLKSGEAFIATPGGSVERQISG